MSKLKISATSAFLLVASSLLVPVTLGCAQAQPGAMRQSAVRQSPAPVIPAVVAAANPFVGTAEHGHTYPGASMPFGMVQVSPDTPLQGWDGSSGYHYSDSVIRGFSHTHLMGTGVGGLGDVLLMPTVGEVQLVAGDPGVTPGYASRFSHAREAATPGYYKVFLDDPKVTAELTATERCGLHKYTFPASNNAHIVLDLEHGVGSSIVESSLKVENATTISGYRRSNGWGGGRDAYFVMEFSKPFASYGVEKDGARQANGTTEATGKAVKAFVNYSTTANEAILVRVGISGTSVEGARRNLNKEIPISISTRFTARPSRRGAICWAKFRSRVKTRRSSRRSTPICISRISAQFCSMMWTECIAGRTKRIIPVRRFRIIRRSRCGTLSARRRRF